MQEGARRAKPPRFQRARTLDPLQNGARSATLSLRPAQQPPAAPNAPAYAPPLPSARARLDQAPPPKKKCAHVPVGGLRPERPCCSAGGAGGSELERVLGRGRRGLLDLFPTLIRHHRALFHHRCWLRPGGAPDGRTRYRARSVPTRAEPALQAAVWPGSVPPQRRAASPWPQMERAARAHARSPRARARSPRAGPTSRRARAPLLAPPLPPTTTLGRSAGSVLRQRRRGNGSPSKRTNFLSNISWYHRFMLGAPPRSKSGSVVRGTREGAGGAGGRSRRSCALAGMPSRPGSATRARRSQQPGAGRGPIIAQSNYRAVRREGGAAAPIRRRGSAPGPSRADARARGRAAGARWFGDACAAMVCRGCAEARGGGEGV